MSRLKSVFLILIYLLSASYGYSKPVVLKDINGKKIPFASLKGRWVFINYWASWCQPCLDEIAELNRFYKDKKNRVALFAVNYDMLPLAQQMDLIRKYNIRYPSLQEDPANQLNLGAIAGVPATFVFNPAGKLSQTLYGEQTLLSLNKVLEEKIS